MCPVCGVFLDWLCFVVRRGMVDSKKEGSARRDIVRELVCLLGGGIGCGIARRRLTCSRV